MEVKGTGIKTTRDFVKEKYANRYDEWLSSLNEESKKIYSGIIGVSGWFPIKQGYYEPIEKISQLFYNGNSQKSGDELGRYSAENALKGVYKVFLLVATPQYLMKKAASMMQAFYNPSLIEISEVSQKRVIFKIKQFDKITRTTEYRIAGWCARAVEMCNCKNVNYRFLSHLSAGQPETIIEFNWD